MKNLNTVEMHTYYMLNKFSLNKVGEKFGISGPALRKRFIKANLPTKSRVETRKKKLDLDYLEFLYSKQNYSMDEIADKLGCSSGTIWNKICKLGINKTSAEAKAQRQDNYKLWTSEFTKYVQDTLRETNSITDTANITGASLKTIEAKNCQWKIQVGYWNRRNSKIGKILLEKHKDYDKVSQILGITTSNLSSKNHRDWKVDLSDNSNIFGIPTIGIDKIKYRSKIEASVANLLYKNNINYECEVRVCSSRRWRCDFKIGNLWIEVDGLGEKRINCKDELYDTHEKIAYYKKNNFNYLILNKNTWKKQLEEVLGI